METTEEVISVRSLPSSFATLRLLYSGDQGIVQRPPTMLEVSRFPIGRGVDPPCLCLPHDKRASRLHASIHLERGKLRVVDEHSRNGTFVNGQKVDQSPLQDGDVLRVGDSLFLLRFEPSDTSDTPMEGLLGRAPAVRKLRSHIKLVASTPATVLLLGESGVGKEVVSRALHSGSGRSGPFVAINCGAIPETLAESQLFGHVRGAFTGAAPHPGMFRTAEMGTLFLDELGELPLPLQPKLLRVLEERMVLPVGATQPIPCDVRVVAATNRDLASAVAAGTFRGDLFARLAEFSIHIPPLRERREDILFLLQQALDLPHARISADLAERLLLYSWPFNVRELLKLASELRIRGSGQAVLELNLVEERLVKNPSAAMRTPVIERASPSHSESLRSEPISGPADPDRSPIPTACELEALLVKHHGSIANVAKATGRSRAQVYRWMKQHGINMDSFRSSDP